MELLCWDLYWRCPVSGGLVATGHVWRAEAAGAWLAYGQEGPAGADGEGPAHDPLGQLLEWGLVARARALLGPGCAPGAVRSLLLLLTAAALSGRRGAAAVAADEGLAAAVAGVWVPGWDGEAGCDARWGDECRGARAECARLLSAVAMCAESGGAWAERAGVLGLPLSGLGDAGDVEALRLLSACVRRGVSTLSHDAVLEAPLVAVGDAPGERGWLLSRVCVWQMAWPLEASLRE